jgi:hypothetical protein
MHVFTPSVDREDRCAFEPMPGKEMDQPSVHVRRVDSTFALARAADAHRRMEDYFDDVAMPLKAP